MGEVEILFTIANAFREQVVKRKQVLVQDRCCTSQAFMEFVMGEVEILVKVGKKS
jgi:hypothetical protein